MVVVLRTAFPDACFTIVEEIAAQWAGWDTLGLPQQLAATPASAEVTKAQCGTKEVNPHWVRLHSLLKIND